MKTFKINPAAGAYNRFKINANFLFITVIIFKYAFTFDNTIYQFFKFEFNQDHIKAIIAGSLFLGSIFLGVHIGEAAIFGLPMLGAICSIIILN